ncbi:MAG: thiosulfate oxidation carrier complex protein SoxZ [Gammaproteobacteria bacterium]|nr:thiosulfate oxidation carrier complex protein SoxZ [Gammaproteobacteria bacterium]
MAERKMKVRTRPQDGAMEVLMLVTHPMETGQRVDKKTNQKIPAHFIQRITLEHNDKIVLVADTSVGISEDPLLGFRLKSAKKGDKVKLSWKDNKGESGSTETVVDA